MERQPNKCCQLQKQAVGVVAPAAAAEELAAS